ncbi:hypothetical protein H4Q26_001924 [Puccinia striiformis f. sp. tritici PST-130]|nr:hypothetical protein H4Q26_001924 [Puccinia striiformis f. sp. tritici PST-130]
MTSSTKQQTTQEKEVTPPPTLTSNQTASASVRRESARRHMPINRLGFLTAQKNPSSAPAPDDPEETVIDHPAGSDIHDGQDSDSEDEPIEVIKVAKTKAKPPLRTNGQLVVKQVSKNTGQEVMIDVTQDSDGDNRKVAGRKPKQLLVDKDGFDHPRVYFFPIGQGPKQDENSEAFACRWCPNKYLARNQLNFNLRVHRNGAVSKGNTRAPCAGRSKAIAAGANLPPTAAQLSAEAKKPDGATNTIIAYTTRGMFDNTTLNKLIVIWLVRHSLPWLQIEDFHLRVCFDYATHSSQLRSRIWAALHAHELYLEHQAQVIKDIKESNSMISLVSDVWTTKGSHKAFVGISCSYVNQAYVLALNVSKKMVRPEKANKPFPFLTPIIEGDEPGLDNDAVGEEVNSDDEEVDPDDATPDVMADGWEEPNPNDDDEAAGEDSENPIGIAFTLKKIDYICRRIASSPQKQAEWKVWAAKLGFTGRGVINGYGIRWNIAYESRQRAYEGRRVIKQLIENENDRLAGKSAKDHFFKSYELSSNEWVDIHNLNNILKEFLEMTKRMEGNWPIVSMVIYEYVRLIDSLEKKMAVAAGSSLEAMYPPMIRITKKYLKIALKCDSIVMATFLHPAWRMMLFSKRLEPPMTRRITELINNKFIDAESSDSEGDEFNFYPTNEAADNVVNTELERYNNGDFPMDKKGKLLGWWKESNKFKKRTNEANRRLNAAKTKK